MVVKRIGQNKAPTTAAVGHRHTGALNNGGK